MKSCINCNKELNLSDKFCPECGQSTNNKLNLNVLFADLIGNYLSFDARFFKTIIPLLFKPGYVAKAFINGKRKTYLHPGKIYLFISVLFFFLFSLSTRSFNSEINKNLYEEVFNDINVIHTDSTQDSTLITPINTLSDTTIIDTSASRITSLQQQQTKLLESDNVFLQQLGKIIETKGQNIFNVFFNLISIAIFLLVPIYALFLKLLFYKSYSFTQHLVFSLYLFSFGFLVSTLYLGLYSWDENGYIMGGLCLLFFIYLTFSFKYFYNKTFTKSLLKASIQSLIFIGVLTPTTFILLIISSIYMY